MHTKQSSIIHRAGLTVPLSMFLLLYNLVCWHFCKNSDFLSVWLDYNLKGGWEQEPFYGVCVSFINQKLKPVRDCSLSNLSICHFSMIVFFVNWISLGVRLLDKTRHSEKLTLFYCYSPLQRRLCFHPRLSDFWLAGLHENYLTDFHETLIEVWSLPRIDPSDFWRGSWSMDGSR